MGRMRLRSQVREVMALAPSGENKLAAERPTPNGAVLTWENFRLEDIGFSIAQANRLAEVLVEPVCAISIRYLSPTKIKERGQWAEPPEMAVVMRALVRRLRILSVVHGDGEWPQEAYGPFVNSRTLMYQRCAANVYRKNGHTHCESLR